MRRVTAMVSAAAIVLWTVTAMAQAKPDFSGKWTREMPAAGAGGGGGAAGGGGGGGGRGGGGGGGGAAFACPMTCAITQTAAKLTIDYTQGETAMKREIMLDGTDSKITLPGRQGGAPTELVAKAKWDGNKLVVTVTRDMGGTPVTSTQTLSIEAGKLTVVTNSGREGATPQTATYTKG